MNFQSVVMESLGYVLPEKILTSEDIETRLASVYEDLHLSKGRLELMTGIRERRVWPLGERPSGLSAAAGKKALEASSLDPSQIEVLIHASVCRDFLEPASAGRVHHLLNLPPRCLVFDLSNACLGVLDAWILLGQMIEAGQIKAGMVVAGENSGPLLEETIGQLLEKGMGPHLRGALKKSFANFTIGSGAFASILSHKDLSPHSPRLLGGSVLTSTADFDLCQGQGDLHSLKMETDSEKLLHAGLSLSRANWEFCKETLGWTNETPEHTLTHQVGRRHHELLYEHLKLPPQKDFSTFPFLGNTGSVALPLTLALGKERKLYRKGDRLALLGIGSGLHSLMLGMEWNNL